MSAAAQPAPWLWWLQQATKWPPPGWALWQRVVKCRAPQIQLATAWAAFGLNITGTCFRHSLYLGLF